jgi:hypothetical protein
MLPGYIHRQFIGAVIVMDMVEGRGKQAAGEKEARKRTRRREPQDQPRQSQAWTQKALGGKTIWEWLQLLIIPVALAVIGFLFTMQQEWRQHQLEERRAQVAQNLEDQRAQDAALQAYLDQMSNLLLEKDLRESAEGSAVRQLARARTLTVLQTLDLTTRQRSWGS